MLLTDGGWKEVVGVCSGTVRLSGFYVAWECGDFDFQHLVRDSNENLILTVKDDIARE